VVAVTEELATKSDLRELRHELSGEIQELRSDFAEFKADMRGWMLQFFVPLWIGVYATLGALVVSIVLKR
jgi:hypothetical protein